MKTALCAFLVCGTAVVFADSDARPAFDALRAGRGSEIQAAIDRGLDVNSRDEDGNTLLMQAAVYGTVADLQFLLAHKADVNAASRGGHTALMRAMPDLAKIKLLVEHGANVNAAASDGHTPLMLAAGIPTAEDVVRYLIAKGAKVQATDRAELDALRIAAVAGAAGNLKALLDAGADARGKIVHANRVNLPGVEVTQSVVDRALRAREGATALMGAAVADCEACVRMLLDRGADAKAATGSGMTALHDAAYTGNAANVRMLLAAGAAVNVADERGFTPLMMAANSRSRNPEVVRMLLDRGADKHATDESGRSAADWARIGSTPEIMALLGVSGKTEMAAPGTAPASKDVRQAAEKSVALLESTAPNFFRSTGCISCHNVSIPMITLTEARHRGYAVKPASTQMLMKQTAAFLSPHRDNMLSGYCSIPGITTTATYGAISMHDEGRAADAFTDSVTRCLLLEQRADGSFEHGDTRPPLSPETGIPTTALSIEAMRLYPVAALQRQIESAESRARTYLTSAKAWYVDDYAFRVLGLYWSGAPQSDIAKAVRDLLSQQRADGGWAQSPDRSPDAYATGLALSALSMTDPASPSSPAYRRGVEYLVRSQEADGSWHVHTRAFGFQPYFQSGFPHDHDQWISMAATAWSARALMPAVDSADLAKR